MARMKKVEKQALEREERMKQAELRLARERAIVRAMTYEELVTATCELLTKETSLGIIVERSRDAHAKIYLTTLGGGIRLGYISVTQHVCGSYSVAGTSAGCFMANDSENDIRNVLREAFEALEAKANAPNNLNNQVQYEEIGIWR